MTVRRFQVPRLKEDVSSLNGRLKKLEKSLEREKAAGQEATKTAIIAASATIVSAIIAASVTAIEVANKVHDNVEINAKTEAYKAILQSKHDFFVNQDRIFAEVIDVTSAMSNEIAAHDTDILKNPLYLSGDTKYQQMNAVFMSLYRAKMATVENSELCDTMTMFYDGLAYCEGNKDAYTDANTLWKKTYTHKYQDADPDPKADIPTDPQSMIGNMQILLSYKLKQVVDDRANPCAPGNIIDSDHDDLFGCSEKDRAKVEPVGTPSQSSHL